MSLNLDPRLRQALADVLQEALSRGEAVQIPGFGTLSVAHQSAEIARDPNGGFSLRPPRRSVRFEPESI